MIEARSLPLAVLTMSNAKRRCEALLGPHFHLFEGEWLFVPALIRIFAVSLMKIAERM